jgi:hypothetical protein
MKQSRDGFDDEDQVQRSVVRQVIDSHQDQSAKMEQKSH